MKKDLNKLNNKISHKKIGKSLKTELKKEQEDSVEVYKIRSEIINELNDLEEKKEIEELPKWIKVTKKT